jgi:hypothetical protein
MGDFGNSIYGMSAHLHEVVFTRQLYHYQHAFQLARYPLATLLIGLPT